MFPKRIATNRDFRDKSVEYIELHENGALMWVAEDEGHLYDDNGNYYCSWSPSPVGCSFPVDIEFVQDFFTKIGRKLDLTKLPSNAILHPYS
jgi:hypothetical protein